MVHDGSVHRHSLTLGSPVTCRVMYDMKQWIESWRKLWNRPDLPIYFVQIAPTSYAGGNMPETTSKESIGGSGYLAVRQLFDYLVVERFRMADLFSGVS